MTKQETILRAFEVSHIENGHYVVAPDGSAYLVDSEFENPVFITDNENYIEWDTAEEKEICLPDLSGNQWDALVRYMPNQELPSPFYASDFSYVDQGLAKGFVKYDHA